MIHKGTQAVKKSFLFQILLLTVGLSTQAFSQATQVRVETKADGSGVAVPGQNLASRDTIRVYAITRTAGGVFVGNIRAAWSLDSLTGGMVAGDLVPSGDSTSALLRGRLVGSGKIRARAIPDTLISVTSGRIFVIPGIASRLNILTDPSPTATAGIAFATQPVVRIEDANGNLVTADNTTTVTATRLLGTGVLQGTLAKIAVAGVASFTNLMHTVAGTITIRFTSSPVLTPDTSVSIVVSPGLAARLVFVSQPGNAVAGTVIAPPETVQVQDAFGNTVVGAGRDIVASIHTGTGTLLGTTSRTTNALGTVVFNDLRVNLSGSKTIKATSTPLDSAISSAFVISAAPARKLTVRTQPSPTATAGIVFPQQPVVAVEDTFGNLVTTDNTTSVVATRNLGSGILQGTTTIVASGGLVTFSNLRHLSSGTMNIRFRSTPALDSTVSSNVVVAPGLASKLVFGQQPTNTASGAPIVPPLTVQLRDTFDNNVTTAGLPVLMALSSGTGVLSGTTTQNTSAAGLATFGNLSINLVGTKTLTASRAGLASAVSNPFAIRVGSPATIDASAGTPQSAEVNTPFATNLEVTVRDAAGNLISDSLVTFVKPSTGASGTFTGGIDTVRTNAAGVARAPVFTANTVAGPYSVSATVAGVLPAVFALTNTPGPARRILSTAGSGQSTPISTAFPINMTATVRDTFGNSISGAVVRWTRPTTGPTGTFLGGVDSAVTNALGAATAAPFIAGIVAGPFSVTATTAGVTTPTAFALTNLAGPPNQVIMIAGSPQSTQVGMPFTNNLKAKVVDGANNGIRGLLVKFTKPATGASGTFTGGIDTVRTDSLGIATAPIFTANVTAGSYNDSAFVVGTALPPAIFSLTNLSGPAGSITSNTAPQSATVNAPFGVNLSATVRDASGNTVSNALVTFSAPTTGQSGTFPGGPVDTVRTNASGIATARVFTANTIAGRYVATASAPGVLTPATFNLTNNPAVASRTIPTAGTPQSTTVGTPFATQFKARVTDQFGNGIRAVTVQFLAPTLGPRGNFAGNINTATTDSTGEATAGIFTANPEAGSYLVRATSAGTDSATYSLTNLPAAAASISATGGNTQNTIVNTFFADSLRAIIRDISGNPVPGVQVTFAAPLTGASGKFQNDSARFTLTTNSIGTVAVRFRADTIAGVYSVNATASGVATPAQYSLRNTPAGVATVSIVAGGSQNAVVNRRYAVNFSLLIRDSYGNNIPGVLVGFEAPNTGASGRFPGGLFTTTHLTDTTGVATAAAFTANSITGRFSVTTSVAGQPPAVFSLRNLAGSPARMNILAGGSPQSTPVTTAFPVRFRVELFDSFDNRAHDVVVTYTAPISGARGTFTGGVNNAITDSLGIATPPVFTANAITGRYEVIAEAAGVTARFSLTNLANAVSTIVATAGTPQTAQVATAFPLRFSVLVRDAFGNAVPNTVVNFSPPSTGPTGFFDSGISTATTDSNGAAIARQFTANNIAGGPYFVRVTAGTVDIPNLFELRNRPGPATSITAIAGTPDSAIVGTLFQRTKTVLVRDAFFNGVLNDTVTITVPLSGPSIAGIPANPVTDAQGQASFNVSANLFSGSYQLGARISGSTSPALFQLKNLATLPNSIRAISGTPQSTQVNDTFRVRFRSIVRDQFQNPVPNATVTFTAPTTGQTGTFQPGGSIAIITTGDSGIATAPVFRANGTLGSYIVRSSVTGVAGVDSFSLTNTIGPPGRIVIIAGDSQSVRVGSAYPVRFRVRVLDANNFPVPNTIVTWAPPQSGPTGFFEGNRSTATTDAGGIAEAVVFTANNAVGGFDVPASAPGVSTPILFRLRNIPGGPKNSTILAGASQRTQVISAFPVQFKVSVADTFNNPVPGVLVTFTAPPQSGPSGTFPGAETFFTIPTDSLGVAAAATFVANTRANRGNGVYNLSYAVPGLSGLPTFQLGNNPRLASRILAVSGSGQSATVNRQFANLVARVTDDLDNPRSRDTVRFAAPLAGSSGTFPGGRRDTFAITNDDGDATAAPFTANSTAGGPYNVTATRLGISTPASFALTNAPSGGSSISATGGTPQSAQVNQRFAARLQATVLDSSFNPVPNVVVIFNTPVNGASATFTGGINQFTTNQNGIATTDTVLANAIAGTYTIAATIPGGSSPATYSLTNLTSGAASVRVTGGTPQAKQVNTQFDSVFSVVVRDASSNPIGGATVTFTAPDTGASGKFLNGQRTMTASTDTLGRASSARFTADTIAGRYSVYASVPNLAQRDSFSLNNLHAQLNSFIVESPAGGQIGTQLTLVPFTVRISARDRFNNIATSFTDSVAITSNAQLASGGGVTPLFAGGVLSRQFVVRRAATNPVRLTATRITGGSQTGSSNAFQVNNPVPAFASISPDTGKLLETMTLAVAGTNFIDSIITGINVGTGITLNWLTVDNANLLRANISITSSAALGVRPLTLSNAPPGGGPSNVRNFFIDLPLPQPPVLAGPSNGSRNNPRRLALTWSSSVLTSLYHLQVSSDSTFRSFPGLLDGRAVNDSTIADTTKLIGPLTEGTKYYWRVRAINNRGSGEFTPFKSFSTVPAYPSAFALSATVEYPSFQKPGDYSSTDYRLVGLPGDPSTGGIRLNQLLNGAQDVDWVVYRDNGAAQEQGAFIPYNPNDDGFRLSPGRGFWILRNGNLDISSLTVPTAPFDTATSAVTIPLVNGWNIVTNPLVGPVPLTEMRALNGNFSEALWSFTGVWATTGGMQPYQGYYFFNNNGSLSSLKIPFGVFASLPKEASKRLPDGEWHINIEFVSSSHADRSTVLGVAPGARQGLDSLEYRKPRTFSGMPNIYLNRPEWDDQYSGFAVDFRPGVDVLETWPFEVHAKSTDPLELRFDGVADVPSHLEVFLIDEQRARYVDLRSEPVYRFRLPTGGAELKVIVGKHGAVQEVLNSVLPKEFALGNNFPNPFNPATTIPVAIPHTADVAVRVYNILGEEVRTVHAGPLEAGRHFMYWDGRNNQGFPVASGTYLTRFTTNTGKAFTGKMILMK